MEFLSKKMKTRVNKRRHVAIRISKCRQNRNPLYSMSNDLLGLGLVELAHHDQEFVCELPTLLPQAMHSGWCSMLSLSVLSGPFPGVLVFNYSIPRESGIYPTVVQF